MLKSLGIELEFVSNPVPIGIEELWIKLASRDKLTGKLAADAVCKALKGDILVVKLSPETQIKISVLL